MGNIESMFFIQYITDSDYNINNNNKLENIDNKILENIDIKNYNKLDNINQCHICNKKLSNKTIYRGNDLSFCSIKHRDLLNELKI